VVEAPLFLRITSNAVVDTFIACAEQFSHNPPVAALIDTLTRGAELNVTPKDTDAVPVELGLMGIEKVALPLRMLFIADPVAPI
jgi:hypothetical protein